jgi:hypothetical protein
VNLAKLSTLFFAAVVTAPLNYHAQAHDNDNVSSASLPLEAVGGNGKWSKHFEKVAEQMRQYSSSVKTFKKFEQESIELERSKRIDIVSKKKSIRSFCGAVKDQLVKKSYADGQRYGNCGEGALVAACLAWQNGFLPQDIYICSATGDHHWTLVPEANSKEYCLLDRLNSPQCDISVVGFKSDVTTGGFKGESLQGIGKKHPDSSFQKPKCMNFPNYVADQNFYSKEFRGF